MGAKMKEETPGCPPTLVRYLPTLKKGGKEGKSVINEGGVGGACTKVLGPDRI